MRVTGLPTYSESSIICAWCGCETIPIDSYDDGDCEEWRCGKCGQVSDLEVEVTYKFRTTKNMTEANLEREKYEKRMKGDWS